MKEVRKELDDAAFFLGLGRVLFLQPQPQEQPAETKGDTAMLKGELIGTRMVSNVHSMNFATGVMISCVFMVPKFGTKISNR